MPDKSPKRFPTEGLGEAYEKLLILTMKESKLLKEKTGPALHNLIDDMSEKFSDLEELTKEQSEKIAEYLKRDLTEAANYMVDSGDDFKKWLAIDTELIEDFLLDHMMQAADQTTIELNKLKNAAQTAEYHTGEVTGPGVLICDHCGEQIHFNNPGHIPPCAKCQGTQFHRLLCK